MTAELGLPPVGHALYWVLKCATAPGPPEGGGADPARFDAVRQGLQRLDEGEPLQKLRAYLNAVTLLSDTPGIGPAGARAFERFAGDYATVADAVAGLPRAEALWRSVSEVFLPVWAERFTEKRSRWNPVGYLMGPERPCPIEGEAGSSQSTEANLWYVPALGPRGWRTPVATTILRVLRLLDTNRPSVAKSADALAPGETAAGSFHSWKQALGRWTGAWTTARKTPVPRPDSVRRLVSLLDGLSVPEANERDPGEANTERPNVYAHFLDLDDADRYAYVAAHYWERGSGDGTRSQEPDGLASDVFSRVAVRGERIAEQVQQFAEAYGALTPDRLLRALVIARAVQVACFGMGSKTPGLRQLAATVWGDGEADAEMADLLGAYRDAVTWRVKRSFGASPSLGELVDRLRGDT